MAMNNLRAPTASAYSLRDLKFDLVAGALGATLYAISQSLKASGAVLLVLGFFALGGAFSLSRAYYEGTSMFILAKARPMWISVVTALLPCAAIAALLIHRADGVVVPESWRGWVGYIMASAIVAGGAYKLVLVFRPQPRVRAYLMAVAVIAVVSYGKRQGVQIYDGESIGYEASQDATPGERRSRALFAYLALTAASWAGVAVATMREPRDLRNR